MQIPQILLAQKIKQEATRWQQMERLLFMALKS